MTINCKICRSRVSEFSKAKLLQKYLVGYYKCDTCGFVFTEKPYWIKEAYRDSINITDTGLVARNLNFIKLTRLIIMLCFDSNAKFLDYGGGYGLFVRLMRDAGFDFYWVDRYSRNLLSRGFEYSTKHIPYEMVTAFEVFEHMRDPMAYFSQILNYSDNILFSTFLLPKSNPKPGEWWYYGLEHGQHISFYSLKTLMIIAKKMNRYLYSNNKNIHLISNKNNLGKTFFKLISSKFLYLPLGTIARKKSLTKRDSILLRDSKML